MTDLSTWSDVDGFLELMGRLDLDIAVIEAELGVRLYDLVTQYGEKLVVLKAQREGLESLVADFCLERKAEFAKKRSKQLTFGKIAFRVAERIEVPAGLEPVVIATLKRLGLVECIETREKLIKQALKQLTDNDLAKAGLKRLKDDKFRIEPNLQVVAEKVGKVFETPAVLVDMEKLAGAVKVAKEAK